jgi:putative protease
MNLSLNPPELLAPAGDFERLQMAVEYGADAVYLGSQLFSMRASPENFTQTELARAVEYAHSRSVRVYLTCNTVPHNSEIELLPRFLEQSAATGIDAFIISDFGVLDYAKRYAPQVETHISTQAGIVNYASANAFFNMGAKRVVLAREMSLAEIGELRQNTPAGLEIETFVHGAMCVSFSGRCLISSYLTARDSNRGDCSQPCRWNYALMEEKRKGQYMPVFEDERGTHILNSRDLCMIEHIPELIDAGITSFKLEGRAKSAYYTAVVTNAYRLAIDEYRSQREHYTFNTALLDEVKKVSNRGYCTGFFYGPIQNGQNYSNVSYERGYDIVAVVEHSEGGVSFCRQRNYFSVGNAVEIIEPGKLSQSFTIAEMFDENGDIIQQAKHPDMRLSIKSPYNLKPFSVIRKLQNSF